MSTFSQFVTNPEGPLAAIVNGHSAGGTESAIAFAEPAVQYLSGSTTAGTLKTLLSVTGRGRVNVLSLARNNTTSKTIRLKVTIDGTVVFDATSTTGSTNLSGLIALGTKGSGSSYLVPQPAQFTTSILVEGTSSVSETNGLILVANYEVWA